MRKSFRGLSGLIRQRLQADPLSGHIFCFVTRRRTMLKCLVHNRSGYLIYYKRLSRGTFEWPAAVGGGQRFQIDAGTLALILEGIELKSVKRRMRHQHRAVCEREN
jgi:transposase